MNYLPLIKSLENDPPRLEALYMAAREKNETNQFQEGLVTCYQAHRQNQLLAAWYYRFQSEASFSANLKAPVEMPLQQVTAPRKPIQWKFAVPLAIVNALVFWLLSDPTLAFTDQWMPLPFLIILATPLIAIFTILYLALSTPALKTSRKLYQPWWKPSGIDQMGRKAVILPIAVLAVITAYAFLLCFQVRTFDDAQFRLLVAVHLPILSWGAVGICILGLSSEAHQRFSFLIKSIEIFVIAGLFLLSGMVFGVITMGLFTALSVDIPELIIRLATVGGAGLIPLLAIAVGYDPFSSPSEQDFAQGLGKLIATLPRLLLPLSLIVITIYIFVIPFSFLQPFTDRDVLIVYNVMLFAVMGLLVGATPIKPDDISPRLSHYLRLGFSTLCALVILVSIYALSATVYRAILNGLTMNRLTIIGWNTINISLLSLLLIKAIKHKQKEWIQSFHWVFGVACTIYLAWSFVLLLAVQWLF